VIFPTLGEFVPKGFSCVEQTPTGRRDYYFHSLYKDSEVDWLFDVYLYLTL
jgi:hypothetical protein